MMWKCIILGQRALHALLPEPLSSCPLARNVLSTTSFLPWKVPYLLLSLAHFPQGRSASAGPGAKVIDTVVVSVVITPGTPGQSCILSTTKHYPQLHI